MTMAKKKTSVVLTEEAIRLLALLAEKYGISRSAMLEVIIRKKAQAEDVEL